jgi:hypothetical protein
MAERGERWSDDVEFTEAGEFAYRPGDVLVPSADEDEAEEWLGRRQPSREGGKRSIDNTTFTQFPNVEDPLIIIGELRARGIVAQPNHVLFNHCLCCGCGPHPSAFSPGSYAGLWAYPFGANPFGANPFGANPFGANPFGANPFGANPFGANPFGANPFGANPFGANPFGANPEAAETVATSPTSLVAPGRAGRESTAFRATGLRRHSARPAERPLLADLPQGGATGFAASGAGTIVVVDTGIARSDFLPAALQGVVNGRPSPVHAGADIGPDEIPDEDPADGSLDFAAGHGTFIAGLIDRIVPGSPIEVYGLLNGRGDATELDIVATLNALSSRQAPPKLVNLSFGGYASVHMGVLAEAVRNLQKQGTVVVASAGNDATCRPSYPAAFPGVVSVGALGPSGPAPFTNYGPWVRACAPGVDVVSSFFSYTDPKTSDKGRNEWVRWSGTSFAAPAVVGALARAMGDGGFTAPVAVERVVDDPALFRMPGLGTVVNQTPWFMH